MGLTLGLLLMEDMYDDLPDLLAYGANFMDVAWYYLVLLPSFLPIVLPLALLISVLFSLGNLHRNNEIIVSLSGCVMKFLCEKVSSSLVVGQYPSRRR